MSIPYHFELGLFRRGRPLLSGLARNGLEFDQRLLRALEVSASRPNLKPEDSGFPDSYLTLALYRPLQPTRAPQPSGHGNRRGAARG